MPQPTVSQVREEYRRRGLARVRERDKALGFILGMVSFLSLFFIVLFNFLYSAHLGSWLLPYTQVLH